MTAQERVNCYVDVSGQGDRSLVTLYGMPGVEEFADFGDTPIRGLESLGSYLYVVHRDNFHQLRNDGISADKGDLETSEGRAIFANNNDYLMFVDGAVGYTYLPSSDTFAKITDIDFPANPTSCWFDNGYFGVSQRDSEQFDESSLDDPTSWPGELDLAYSDPDELVRGFAHSGLLVLLGEKSLEYWGFTGQADFPYSRVLASQYGWGLAARHSVAASESWAFALLQRREGGLGVCRLTGAEPELVSPPDHVALLDAYDREFRVDDAVGTSFSMAGHPMYQIHFPTVGVTWLYDAATGAWGNRKTYGLNHYLGVGGVWHNGALFWGDHANGKIWKQSMPTLLANNKLDWSNVVWIDGQDENGNDREVELELTGEHLHTAGNRRFTVDSLEIHIESGLGTETGQGSDPKVMLQMSKDGGHSWGTERLASVGKIGEYKRRLRWVRPTGQARDVVFRLRWTDPTYNRVITDEAVKIREARS